MSEVIIIGLDIAKYVFHVHGADERGRVIFSKRISRGKLLDFFAAQPNCTVALEACGGAHHWARQLNMVDGVQYLSIAVGWGGVFGIWDRVTELRSPGTVYTFAISRRNCRSS